MRINANQLEGRLKLGLASSYLVFGDEPLLVEECCAAIHSAAQREGFLERTVFNVESGFDWNELHASAHTQSLFSARRLIELRLALSRPGDAGTKALTKIVNAPPQDTLLLVVAGRLDKRAQAAAWVRVLERAGLVVSVYSLSRRDLPGWVARRMRARDITPTPEVVDALSYHFEGNLLGVSQEIEKLALLHDSKRIDLDDIKDNLSDNARFSVFALADACLGGDHGAAIRILGRLRGEGTDAVLILRVLARELRTLGQVAVRLALDEQEETVFDAYQIWPRRRALVKQAVRRGGPEEWCDMLSRAARVDRVLKGRLSGDVWLELQDLVMVMTGQRTWSPGVSGV
ncbi:MAG: DNA polymerase III subunit delta [Acidiferrobacterales bacterium]